MSVTHTFPLAVVEARGTGVRSGKGRSIPPRRVHHRSPGVLAISPFLRSGCAQRVQNHASKEMGMLDCAQVLCRVSWEPK